jgi:hypothetical protein
LLKTDLDRKGIRYIMEVPRCILLILKYILKLGMREKVGLWTSQSSSAVKIGRVVLTVADVVVDQGTVVSLEAAVQEAVQAGVVKCSMLRICAF